MKDITYNIAKLTDAHRISILMQTVYIRAYAEEGITFEFSNFIAKRFAQSYIESVIEEESGRLIVACYRGNPIGIAEIIYDGTCPIRKIPMPDLSKLYVLEQFKSKGIGYKLNKAVENQLQSLGYKELFLEVWIKNKSAIMFYKRQGYETIGQVDFPMEKNTYKNAVMTKNIT